MSRSKATKRRKVWVNFIPGDDGGEAFNKKQTAIDSAGFRALAVAVPFIERLPGDVVLSREDADCVRRFLEIVRLDAGMDDAHRIDRVLALLRGRR